MPDDEDAAVMPAVLQPFMPGTEILRFDEEFILRGRDDRLSVELVSEGSQTILGYLFNVGGAGELREGRWEEGR